MINNLALPGGPLPDELLDWLHRQGYQTTEQIAGFLSPDYYHPSSPTVLPDIEGAAALLDDMLNARAKILIWGDFDVDGQTATTMLVEGLRLLGGNVIYHIPDRVEDSHGVQVDKLALLVEQEIPDLLLICDTGSAEVEGVEFAKSKHLPVIISDHHEISEPPPPADYLVNPLRLPEEHPLRTLSGAGVSFLLLRVLFERRGKLHETNRFLDLLALGLVADVVELVGDTRYWLQRGLAALRTTQRHGIIAICQQFMLNTAYLSAQDIGFKIAPVLNSLGRLASAELAVQLLSTTDMAEAVALAAEARALNEQRKMITDQMTQSAIEMIENDPNLLNWEALVLSSPHWNGGIVGIVAARLAEKYEKPVVLLVESEDGSARGSIRAVPGYHVSQALDQIADILEKYGGHELAGGLSVPSEHLAKLRRLLSDAFKNTAQPITDQELSIAATLPFERLTLDFAYQLQRLEPFGQGNPIPLFKSERVQIVSSAKLGRNEKHRRLTLQDVDGVRRPFFWWNSADLPQPEGILDVVYTVGISRFKDNEELQLTLEDFTIVAPADPHSITELQQMIDWRSLPPELAIQRIAQLENDYQIWAEGLPSKSSPGMGRSSLKPTEALLIYTSPPSHFILEEVLKKITPQRVYLLATLPPIQDSTEFLQTLYGLLNTVIRSMDGKTTLLQLAERLAVTETLIDVALQFIQLRRPIQIDITQRGNVRVQEVEQIKSADHETITLLYRRFEYLWQEIAAYRRYLNRAKLESDHEDILSSS
ncbi:MAG: single-stranded-DNA-specific exonuclease RecJ [Phototrophicales bacterium]|nr:MAG: single-stranded-DNA-specific exonuclease RecJ [Phototrophicales bacterium]